MEWVLIVKTPWGWEGSKITPLKLYLFIFRKRGREGGRGRETLICARQAMIGYPLHASSQGPGLQPRHVIWVGIKPATFQFSGWCPTHWATRDRVRLVMASGSKSVMSQRLVYKFAQGQLGLWERGISLFFSSSSSCVPCGPLLQIP